LNRVNAAAKRYRRSCRCSSAIQLKPPELICFCAYRRHKDSEEGQKQEEEEEERDSASEEARAVECRQQMPNPGVLRELQLHRGGATGSDAVCFHQTPTSCLGRAAVGRSNDKKCLNIWFEAFCAGTACLGGSRLRKRMSSCSRVAFNRRAGQPSETQTFLLRFVRDTTE